MADSTVAAYQVTQSNGKLELTGAPYGAVPFGIALPKGSALTPAGQAAVQKLIDSGAYAEILKKWGVEEFGIPTATVNGAVS